MNTSPTSLSRQGILGSVVFTTCSVPTFIASGAAIRRRGALVELELLVKDIEPNRETDFMLQNYARATGFAEAMPPDSHVEVAA